MIWTCHWEQLKDHSGEDIEHRTERGVHKGDDGSATAKFFLPFCQDITSWQLSSVSYRPRLGFSMLSMQKIDKRCDDGFRILGDRFENGGILKGLFDGLVV